MDIEQVRQWISDPTSVEPNPEPLGDPVARALLADIWEFCGKLSMVLDAMGPNVAAMMPPDQAREFLGG